MVEWGIFHSLVSLMTVSGFFMAAISLGGAILRAPTDSRNIDEYLIRLAVGLGVLILVMIAMAAFNLLNRQWLIGILVIPQMLLWRRLLAMVDRMKYFLVCIPRRWKSLPGFFQLIYILLVLEAILILVLDLTPITGWDASVYHLTIPHRFLEAGGWFELPDIVFSYTGLNEEMIFLWGLVLHGEQAAHLMVGAMGLLASVCVYALARHSLHHQDALLATAMFFLVPIIWDESTDLFVDLGMSFFLLTAILAMLRPKHYGKLGPLMIAGFLFGVAFGIKLLAALYVPILAACAWIRVRRMGGINTRDIVMPVMLALLVWAVWPVRSYLLSGNPLYPIANPLFELLPSPFLATNTSLSQWPLLWRLLLAPWFLSAGSYSSNWIWTGGLGPFVLAFSPLAFFFHLPAWLRVWRWPVLFSLLAWLVFTPVPRFALSLMPFLSIYAAYGIRACRLQFPRFPLFAQISVVLIGSMFCVLYLGKTIQRIPVVIGLQSPKAYLTKYDSIYPVASWINHYRIPGKGILLIGERSLRFSMPVYTLMAYSPYFREVFFDLDPDRFMTRLKDLGVAYVVVDSLRSFMGPRREVIRKFLLRYAVKVRIFSGNNVHYEVYKLPAMLSGE